MPLEINPQIPQPPSAVDPDALDPSTSTTSLIAWSSILYNCGPNVAPLRNELGYPTPGTLPIHDGVVASSATPQDVVAWGKVARDAMGQLTSVRNQIVASAPASDPKVQKFLEDYESFEMTYAALISQQYLVTTMGDYNAKISHSESDHEIAVAIYNFAQETHCFTAQAAKPLLFELGGSSYQPGMIPQTDAGVCPPCPTPGTSGGKGGFPWWILLAAAGGYGYYKYKTAK